MPSKSARKYVKILRIKLNSTLLVEVLAIIKDFIARGCKFSLLTINPEIILQAQRDGGLKKALMSADLVIPDGVGLKYAAKFLFGENLNILPGRKLFLDLISLADKKGWRVFLLGGEDNEAEKTAEKLRRRYQKIKILSSPGVKLDKNADPVLERDIKIQTDTLKRINEFKPDILFVGFGAPKQEKWINLNLAKLAIGGAMSVGGTFAYLSGKKPLPPEWLGKAHLEWLWRVVCEPKRIGRIVNAVVIFPLTVFWYRLRQKSA